MNLVFVRHGQSIWNLENKFTGWVDIGLSDKGIQEAIKAGKMAATFTYPYVAPEGVQIAYKVAKGESVGSEVILPGKQVDANNIDDMLGTGF